MALSEQDALSLRTGDVVLVPMLVEGSNNHFDKGMGVTLSLMVPTTTGVRTFKTSEFRSGEKYVANVVTELVAMISKKTIRDGDWVQISAGGVGKVRSLIGDEAVVRLRTVFAGNPKHVVLRLVELERIAQPDDMTDAEKKEFAK